MWMLKEHEVKVQYLDIRGSVDEYEDGTILEKKTTSLGLPLSPNEHHITQIQYYKVLMELNDYEVKDGFLLYMDLGTATAQAFPVIFKDPKKVKAEIEMKAQVLRTSIETGALPKAVKSWLCNYCSFAAICFQDRNVHDLSSMVPVNGYEKEVESDFISVALASTLLDVHKERWEKAQVWLDEDKGRGDRLDNLTVTESPLEISAIVKGEKQEYAVFVGEETFFCPCPDHQTKKSMCKHQLYTVLVTFKQEKIDDKELKKLLFSKKTSKEEKE